MNLVKRKRGRPTEYDEVKEQISLTLTPSAIAMLKEKSAQSLCKNMSQLVERWLREEL